MFASAILCTFSRFLIASPSPFAAPVAAASAPSALARLRRQPVPGALHGRHRHWTCPLPEPAGSGICHPAGEAPRSAPGLRASRLHGQAAPQAAPPGGSMAHRRAATAAAALRKAPLLALPAVGSALGAAAAAASARPSLVMPPATHVHIRARCVRFSARSQLPKLST